MKALVAENDPSVARLIERMIEGFCSIIEAKTYAEVYQAVEHNRFDIVAIDIVLDDGSFHDCLSAVQEIRHKMSGVVIVVWSGIVSEGDVRERLIAAGADGFLPKGAGFTVEGFYRLLLESIENRSMRGETAACDLISLVEAAAGFKKSQAKHQQ